MGNNCWIVNRTGLGLTVNVDALTTLNDARACRRSFYYYPKNCKRRAFVGSEVYGRPCRIALPGTVWHGCSFRRSCVPSWREGQKPAAAFGCWGYAATRLDRSGDLARRNRSYQRPFVHTPACQPRAVPLLDFAVRTGPKKRNVPRSGVTKTKKQDSKRGPNPKGICY